MKRLLSIALLCSCAGAQSKLESAERAAKAFECKLEVVKPYFDDADAARAFVQDVLARRVDPFEMFAELGVAADEVARIGERFKACSPSAPAVKAPAPEPGRELGSL